jgi:hypothetical protein
MFEQKRFAGRHLLTLESQKLNYFWKKWRLTIANKIYVSLIMTLICLDPCQWSLMSLITGNKVKKHTSQGIVKRRKLLKSSILWTKKCTSETAKH